MEVVELHVPPGAPGAVRAPQRVGVGVAHRVLAGGPEQFLEWRVEDWIARPIAEVEVPPLARVYGEALVLERATEQRAVPALQRRATGEVGLRARRRLVVRGRHLDGPAGRQIVQRDVDCGPAIVLRATRRVGHQPARRGGRGIPEHFRHVPRTVGIVYQQAVATRPQRSRCPHQRERGGALQERVGRRVEDAAQEVVGRGVADVEMDARVERCGLDEVWHEEGAALGRRCERAIHAQQLRDGLNRCESKLSAVGGAKLQVAPGTAPRLNLVPAEHERAAAQRTLRGRGEDRFGRLRQSCGGARVHQHDQGAAILIDVERFWTTRIGADQAAPHRGRRRGLRWQRIRQLQEENEQDHRKANTR